MRDRPSIQLSARIRVTALQTGTVAVKERQRDGEGRSRRNLVRVMADSRWTEPLPILAWLIEHPEGPILVDAGETPRVGEPGYFPAWHPYFRFGLREWVAPEESIGSQLRELGIESGDLRAVVLTHLHTDHAGGIDELPGTEIICSRMDHEFSKGLLGKTRGFLPQRWPDWFEPRLVDFEGGPFGAFASHTTLTAAGDIRLVPTPGHTPGHLSVVLDHGDARFFFAGDASYTEELMVEGVVDGVTSDVPAARDSFARIQALLRDRPTVYLPTHDPGSVDRLTRGQTTTVKAGGGPVR